MPALNRTGFPGVLFAWNSQAGQPDQGYMVDVLSLRPGTKTGIGPAHIPTRTHHRLSPWLQDSADDARTTPALIKVEATLWFGPLMRQVMRAACSSIRSATTPGLFLYGGDKSASLLEIKSSGTWHVEIKSLRFARQWDGKSPLEGIGDDVVSVPGGTTALAVAAIAYSGSSNFVIRSYNSSGQGSLLVNEIGAYNGTKALPKGTSLLLVKSSGSWTITSS